MKKKTHVEILVEAHVKSWGFWSAIIATAGCLYFVKTKLDIKKELVQKAEKLESKLSAYNYNSQQINKLVEYQGKIENYLFIIEEKLFFPSQNTFNLQKVYNLSDELEQQINNLSFEKGSSDLVTKIQFNISGPAEDLFYLIREFRSRMWYNRVKEISISNRGNSTQTIQISFDLLNGVE